MFHVAVNSGNVLMDSNFVAKVRSTLSFSLQILCTMGILNVNLRTILSYQTSP